MQRARFSSRAPDENHAVRDLDVPVPVHGDLDGLGVRVDAVAPPARIQTGSVGRGDDGAEDGVVAAGPGERGDARADLTTEQPLPDRLGHGA